MVSHLFSQNKILTSNLLNIGDLKVPETWRPVGKVKKLFIYPVKSCKGLMVDSFLTGKHAAESEGLVDR